MELGGIYFFVNALMNVLSWFVAAALYSLYYPAGLAEPAHGLNMSTLVSMVNYSANVTGAVSAGSPSAVGMQPNGRIHSMLPRAPQVSRCIQARSATCRFSR
jgi:hypothetical protein